MTKNQRFFSLLRQGVKRARRWLWRHAQQWLIALAYASLPHLSRTAIWKLGGCLGALAYRFDRRGSHIADANLTLVYGERLSSGRRRALTRLAYRHAARVLLDVFWFSRHRESRLQAWVRLDSALRNDRIGKAAILATAHLGNWEVAGQALAAQGVALISVAKPIGSDWTTARLTQSREATGQEIVFARGAVRALVRALRRDRLVVLIQDQHTDESEGGIYVDFMGLPAAVSSAAAALSIRMQVPVLVGACLRDARGRYHGRQAAQLTPLPGETVAALTQRISDALAGMIRRHPGQWLWMYKRWKRIPNGVSPARYPFYARREPPRSPAFVNP